MGYNILLKGITVSKTIYTYRVNFELDVTTNAARMDHILGWLVQAVQEQLDQHRGEEVYNATIVHTGTSYALEEDEMGTTKLQTSTLSDAALNWAVAHCLGEVWDYATGAPWSTSWEYAGPIIERECIELVPSLCGKYWYAETLSKHEVRQERCPTPLIAAMRCFVAKKLGNWVEVPNEFIS